MIAERTENGWKVEPICNERKVLDHGSIKLLNLAGPVRRPDCMFDASDRDPAITARISFDNMGEERTNQQDLKLLRYLMDNRHWTPIEMIEVWLEMRLPIFVARQLVRHRTAGINEVSAGYAKLPAEWYIPEAKNVGVKSKSNKQGRDLGRMLDHNLVLEFLADLEMACSDDYDKYEHHLEKGIAPELARSFLHVNHYTHWVYKMDLRNILNFLSLRMHPDAQYEAKVYAEALFDILSQHLPASMAWLEENMKPAEPVIIRESFWGYILRAFREGV